MKIKLIPVTLLLLAALVYPVSAITDLGGNFPFSAAVAINDNGQIVGDAYFTELDQHAVVWNASSGEISELKNANQSLLTAADINNLGQVTGFVETDKGKGLAEYPDIYGVIWDIPTNKVTTTLGAINESAPDNVKSVGDAINNKGQVAGFSTVSSNTYDAAFWDKTVESIAPPIDLGRLEGGRSSMASGINDYGQIVGYSDISAAGDISPKWHAVYWNYSMKEAIHDLGTLPGGGWSRATAINNKGQIVGGSYNESGSWHAVLWNNVTGGAIDLGTLPGHAYSDAYGINDYGQIVGYSSGAFDDTTHAVIWNETTLIPTDLGTLPGGMWSNARDINNFGQIVGSSSNETGLNHAVLWTVAIPKPPEPKPTPVNISVSAEIKEMVITVNGLKALNKGQANSLTTKLNLSIRDINLSKFVAAAGRLRAFGNEVQAFENSKILTEEQGSPLIIKADKLADIIDDWKVGWVPTCDNPGTCYVP